MLNSPVSAILGMFSACLWKKGIINTLLRTGLNGEALGRASCLESGKRKPLWSLGGTPLESERESNKHLETCWL